MTDYEVKQSCKKQTLENGISGTHQPCILILSFNEYQRILKPNGSLVLFFSYRYSGWIAFELERRGQFTFRNSIIFNKTNPLNHFRKTGFRSCHEVGVWLVNDGRNFNKPKTFNFLGQSKMKNVLNYKIWKDWNKQSKHPTEKPAFLIGGLVEAFTNPWEIVLDSLQEGELQVLPLSRNEKLYIHWERRWLHWND